MKREIIITSDGSTTIYMPDWDEQYHSKHGAIQEAYHVFIKSGLEAHPSKNLNILEIGFGTGLNCFITLIEGAKNNLTVDYVGIEAYPIKEDEILQLNYVSELEARNLAHKFEEMHLFPWDAKQQVNENFHLTKRKQFIKDIADINTFDLIYFDAFGARVQPELWTEEIFGKMFEAMKPGGILVTYSAKGSVRRAMQTVGFTVTRLPGPPGKREMLRAVK
ncbi:tRNA (5-methylaminomethyl-2-thiouridine)(34)-methyltransferase MnmD [Flavicella sediminum]|uniref:tRNA (5-methylaminomethyl-2-thiouridine)(34)-methyltransferase MnmD n=1 Tax=Flavicella sediminum TaxID=2585141 RepID=UPI00111CC140|nr:tRNA (5-methylaminomethyl-2-thiouridine)(34)-methyltransferase MnmD [Flavicella sediminum]